MENFKIPKLPRKLKKKLYGKRGNRTYYYNHELIKLYQYFYNELLFKIELELEKSIKNENN